MTTSAQESGRPLAEYEQVDLHGLSSAELQSAIDLFREVTEQRLTERDALQHRLSAAFLGGGVDLVSPSTQRQALKSAELRRRLLEDEGAETYESLSILRDSSESTTRTWVARHRTRALVHRGGAGADVHPEGPVDRGGKPGSTDRAARRAARLRGARLVGSLVLAHRAGGQAQRRHPGGGRASRVGPCSSSGGAVRTRAPACSGTPMTSTFDPEDLDCPRPQSCPVAISQLRSLAHDGRLPTASPAPGSSWSHIHHARYGYAEPNPGYGDSRFAPFDAAENGQRVPTLYLAETPEAALLETALYGASEWARRENAGAGHGALLQRCARGSDGALLTSRREATPRRRRAR